MKEKDARTPGAVASTPASPAQASAQESDKAASTSDQTGWNFGVLLYPFFHRLSGTRQECLDKAEKRWQHWLLRLTPEEIASALDDTYFFLPHVREILFPETSLVEAQLPALSQATALQAILKTSSLSVLTGDNRSADPQARLSEETRRACFERGVLRLTLKDDELSAFRTLAMKRPSDAEDEAIPLHIEWVDVALFPHDIGLLLLKVNIPDDDIRKIVRAFEYARHVFEPQVSFKPVELVSGPSKTGAGGGWTGDWRKLIESLLSAFVNPQGAVEYTLSSDAQVYGEVFRQLIAVAQPPSRITHQPSSAEGHFVSQAERWLHDLLIGHDSSESDWEPSSDRVAIFRARSSLSYWQGWRAGCEWGNLAFILESGNFVNQMVRYNIEYDYLPLFMLTAFQQIRLQRFAGETISEGRELSKTAAEATSLWASLIKFRNQYWFREVTTKPVGAAIYRLLVESLDLDGIQRTVVTELDALRTYFTDELQEREGRRKRRIDVAIAVATFFVPLQVMLFLFPQTPVPWSFLPVPSETRARWTYLGLVAAWIVVVGILYAAPLGPMRRTLSVLLTWIHKRWDSGRELVDILARDDHHTRR